VRLSVLRYLRAASAWLPRLSRPLHRWCCVVAELVQFSLASWNIRLGAVVPVLAWSNRIKLARATNTQAAASATHDMSGACSVGQCNIRQYYTAINSTRISTSWPPFHSLMLPACRASSCMLPWYTIEGVQGRKSLQAEEVLHAQLSDEKGLTVCSWVGVRRMPRRPATTSMRGAAPPPPSMWCPKCSPATCPRWACGASASPPPCCRCACLVRALVLICQVLVPSCFRLL
jgi:hypothetical protein